MIAREREAQTVIVQSRSRLVQKRDWLRTLSRFSGSATSSDVSPTRLRMGATGTPALSRRSIARRVRPPCAIGSDAKSGSEFRVPLFILIPRQEAIAAMAVN